MSELAPPRPAAVTRTPDPPPAPLAFDPGVVVALLFFVSGAACLVLETAAVRAFLELFGSTAASLGAVAAAFLVCLALGALLLGPRADRTKRPLALYALLEGVACAGGLLALFAVGHLDRVATVLATQELAGEPGLLLRLAVTVGILVVPVGALGATLPVLARMRAAARTFGSAAGGLQVASTLGGMVGALLSAAFLLGVLGTHWTWALAAGLNGLAAIGAWLLARSLAHSAGDPAEAVSSRGPEPASASSEVRPRAVPLLISSFIGGFSVLALEILLFRGLGQVIPSGQDSLGVLLAAFLGASAAGSALGMALARDGQRARTGLVIGLVASLLTPLIALVLFRAIALAPDVSFLRFGQGALTWSRRLTSEFLGALLVAGPAAAATAIAFPCACELAPAGDAGFARLSRLGRFGKWVAWLSGSWTAGAAVAGLLVPGTVIPRLGLRGGLLLTAALPVVAFLLLATCGRLRLLERRLGLVAGALVAAVLLVVVPIAGGSTLKDKLQFFQRVAGGSGATLLAYGEDASANIAVVRRPDGEKVLAVNDQLSLGGSGAGRIEAMQAVLPALLHPGPKKALLLGVGAGLTTAAMRDVLAAPDLEIDAVELLPLVIRTLPFFVPENGAVHADPRVHLLVADARAFVRAAPPESYDLIIGDLFFPWEAEAGLLYTQEHFARVKRLLKPDGLFCQWLPGHQLRWEEIGTVGRTFGAVFNGATVWLARPEFPFPVLGLVASRERLEIDVPALARRIESHPEKALLERLGIGRIEDLLSLYVGDEWFFRDHFEEKGLNVVDRPVVEYRSARRVESDAVVALHNRRLLFETHEDVVGRMARTGMEAKERVQLQRTLDVAAREAWQLFDAQTILMLADANRDLPADARQNDPDQLVERAYQLVGGLLASSPDHGPAFEQMVAILRGELARGHFAQVVQGVLTLEEKIGPRARLRNLRGMAFLMATCDPDPQQAAQFKEPLRLALKDFRKALDLDPRLIESQVHLGISLFLEGSAESLAEARAVLSAARDKIAAPERPDGKGLPAAAEAIWLWLEGRKDEAAAWLARAPQQSFVPRIAARMQG